MRNDLNKVLLIGYVGKAFKKEVMPNGKSVINFTLATNSSWIDKDTGEERENAQWHRLAAFGKLADVADEHFKAGTHLYIEGRLQYNDFVDKDGIKNVGAQIVLEEFKFLGKKCS